VFTLILSLLLAAVVLTVLVFLTRHRATRKPCAGARAREARAPLLSEVASDGAVMCSKKSLTVFLSEHDRFLHVQRFAMHPHIKRAEVLSPSQIRHLFA
jgi:hypothetical protein